MTRGVVSFLTTRGPNEAWDTVKRVLEEVGYVQRAAAKKLGVHDRTLYLWLKKHKYADQVKRMRADALMAQVNARE